MDSAGPSVPAGYRVLCLGEIDSTNSEAMRRAKEGDEGPLWLMASSQTMGRGRSGRQWTSDGGNLFASLLLRPDCSLDTALQLSLVAGVAIFDAVETLSSRVLWDSGLTLKWPNDLLIGTQKLAGILIESAGMAAPNTYAVVIGTGLNLSYAPEGAASLADHRATVSPAEALEALATQTESWLGVWGNGSGFDRIREAWQARAFEVGRPIRVKLGDEIEEGRYGGIDETGALRLLGSDGERRITTGDVFLN